MFSRYFRHNIGNSAAALTYYLVFSFFPFIIFASSFVGILELDLLTADAFDNLIPDDIIQLFNHYIIHVNENQNNQLLLFGLVFSIYFPMRAIHSLLDNISLAYGNTNTATSIRRSLLDFAFTVGIMTLIIIAMLLAIIGPSFLSWLSNFITISNITIFTWSTIRFFILAVLMILNLSALYYFAPMTKVKFTEILPGSILALMCWLVYSIGFSFYVENIGNFSALYGSIGTIIILLTWLYFTSVTLILGAELNAAIADIKNN